MEQIRAIVMYRSENRAEIERQRKRIQGYVKANGINILRSYEDNGKAELKYRSAITDARRHAIYGDYDLLLFDNLGVFGNAPDEVTAEIRFLNAHGVKVISLDEGELNVEMLPQLFRSQIRIVTNRRAG